MEIVISAVVGAVIGAVVVGYLDAVRIKQVYGFDAIKAIKNKFGL